jgi:23S rRNA (guanosine2251-2'-O)-methyltransferase
MAKHKQPRGFQGAARGERRDDGRSQHRPSRPAQSDERATHRTAGGRLWLYGRHPVEAALANPKRGKIRLLATEDALAELPEKLLKAPKAPNPEVVERAMIDNLVPDGAVHQGLALLVEPLTTVTIEDLCELENPNLIVVALDRANDPHNIGAILRSAAAFGVTAVILPERHAPETTGTLAKSASGALEHVPLVRIPNLVQALNRLKEHNYWVAGLTADAPQTIAEAKLTGRIVLTVGAEGAGMRRLSAETCDFLVKIPMSGVMESLNMSNAAAIALYELRRAPSKTD